jgi:nucleoside-specific outer membrane channel protein Tsx
MKLKMVLAAALAVAVSAPVLAKDDGDAQSAPKEKKVCRNETVTGSLVAKRRVCMTQAQWDEIAANTRKTMGDMNRHQNMGSDSGSANGASNNGGFGL